MSHHHHSRHRHPYLGGIILITIGVLFLLDNLGYAQVGDLIHTYWPVILVIIGLSLLLRRSDMYEGISTSTSGVGDAGTGTGGSEAHTSSHSFSSNISDRISEENTFGEVNLILTSKNFQGGSISTVFGEVEIDANSIELAPGEQLLRVHTVFGDTRISLPKGIGLRVTAHTSFGSLRVMNDYKDGIFQEMEFKTDGYETAEKKLRLIVSQVFGALRVR
ncbi:MAG: cell wall-active antibiotics response protein LiaF [Bacteroidota bacterium]